MPQSRTPRWTAVEKPVIGMLHVPPLPGSPLYGGNLDDVATAVLRDAEGLTDGGVHALLLENFGDVPFFPRRVPAETVAHMTALAAEVRRRFDVPLGINLLRNDGRGALAVAQAAGGAFIRVNVLCGARVTDQGIVEGIAHDLLRDCARLGAAEIEVLADVNVKHSAAFVERPIEDEVADTFERGGADGVIVSGPATGRAADLDELRAVRAAAGERPVLIGSGVSAETLEDSFPHADGFIVGSSLKRDGLVTNPVDPARVRELMDAWGRLQH